MEERLDRVVSLPREAGSAEERMLRGDLVREMVARKEHGEGVKRIARELGVDRKTVKPWLRLGAWQPRRRRPRGHGRSNLSSSSSSSADRKWTGTEWYCIGNWRHWGSAAVISKCSAY